MGLKLATNRFILIVNFFNRIDKALTEKRL